MNFNQWYAKEQTDILAELEVYDKCRATFYAKRIGIRESKRTAKSRLVSTQSYCCSQGKTYEELLRAK